MNAPTDLSRLRWHALPCPSGASVASVCTWSAQVGGVAVELPTVCCAYLNDRGRTLGDVFCAAWLTGRDLGSWRRYRGRSFGTALAAYRWACSIDGSLALEVIPDRVLSAVELVSIPSHLYVLVGRSFAAEVWYPVFVLCLRDEPPNCPKIHVALDLVCSRIADALGSVFGHEGREEFRRRALAWSEESARSLECVFSFCAAPGVRSCQV